MGDLVTTSRGSSTEVPEGLPRLESFKAPCAVVGGGWSGVVLVFLGSSEEGTTNPDLISEIE